MTKRTLVRFSRLEVVREPGKYYNIPETITMPKAAYKTIIEISNIEREHQEVFYILTVNTKHKVNSLHEISRGTLDSATVHPRDVFKVALLHNASSIFLCHNHPSGDPTPSKEDIIATERMLECGKLLGIDVLDHIIVGENTYISLKERGNM